MHIFITGIAGFIGFHLATTLHKQGASLIGCDDFNDYYDPNLKRTRASILRQLGIQIYETDIRNRPFLSQILAKSKLTHFIHLAAQPGVRSNDPTRYIQSNLEGFIQVLEVVKFHPKVLFIYASSSSVYGINQTVPFSEKEMTDTPCNLYGATKKSNELIAHSYHHIYGIPTIGLRFFSVYGPWGRPDMAYFLFADKIMKRVPIVLYSNMYRDFTYIDDIVNGIMATLNLQKVSYEVFNLGKGKPESVKKLLTLLEQGLGREAITHTSPAERGEIAVTYADISKSQRELQFNPQVTLEEGIAQFIEWYQSRET